MTDLPPELLARVFTHLFSSDTLRVYEAVPTPTLPTDSGLQEASMLTRRGWAASVGAAGACRSLRAAFFIAVTSLHFAPLQPPREEAAGWSPQAVAHCTSCADVGAAVVREEAVPGLGFFL